MPRNLKTVKTVADATSITPDSNFDVNKQTNTQSTGTFTVNAPSGPANDMQLLELWFKTTNPQTYSFNSAIVSPSSNAPTVSSAGKTDRILLQRNAATSKWDIIAYSTN